MKRLRTPRASKPLGGRVTVPGDKSISHRALLFGALASGGSRVGGLGRGADVATTARVLQELGVSLTNTNGVVELEGSGWDGIGEPSAPLDCGNSGTTMRALTGVLAGARGAFVLTGDESLRRRPMLRIVAPLRQMGAAIDGRAFGDRAPLFVRGSELRGVDHMLNVASAQVKTALLLAGLRADGTTTVMEPGLSRDHTERMLAAAGAPVVTGDAGISTQGGAELHSFELQVPGDPSAAAFLVVAALLLEGSDLTITDVGLNPTRIGFVEVLRAMGGAVGTEETERRMGEPVGTIDVQASPLTATTVAPDQVPRLIDEVPVLAVAATQAEGVTTFEGVRELRVKESDRITAIADGLRKLGGRVEVGPDSLAVEGPTPLHGGVVDSYGDHRIAMSLAIAGLLTPEKVTVKGWSAVDVSWPDFLDDLDRARA